MLDDAHRRPTTRSSSPAHPASARSPRGVDAAVRPRRHDDDRDGLGVELTRSDDPVERVLQRARHLVRVLGTRDQHTVGRRDPLTEVGDGTGRDEVGVEVRERADRLEHVDLHPLGRKIARGVDEPRVRRRGLQAPGDGEDPHAPDPTRARPPFFPFPLASFWAIPCVHGRSRGDRHARRAPSPRLPDGEGGIPADLCVLERRRRLRARRPLPPHGVPAAPGHRRERAGHLPLAQRPLRPAVRRHVRSLGRRRAGLPGRDRRRHGHRRRRARTRPHRYLTHRLEEGLEQGITLVIAKAVLGLLAAGVDAARDRRAPASRSGPATARRAGAPGSRCSPPWRTCSPISTKPTMRSRWCRGWPSCRATRAAAHRASRCSRCAAPCPETQLDVVVPPVRRDAVRRRRRAHAGVRHRRP